MRQTKWKAQLVKPRDFSQIDPRREMPFWLGATHVHHPSCVQGQLIAAQHKEALVFQEEQIAQIKAGNIQAAQALSRLVRNEFRCECPVEISHMETVVPCCDVFVSVPLEVAPDGTPLEFVHLDAKKGHLYGTGILCVSCYSIYTLEEGYFTKVVTPNKSKLQRILEKKWVGSGDLDDIPEGLIARSTTPTKSASL